MIVFDSRRTFFVKVQHRTELSWSISDWRASWIQINPFAFCLEHRNSSLQKLSVTSQSHVSPTCGPLGLFVTFCKLCHGISQVSHFKIQYTLLTKRDFFNLRTLSQQFHSKTKQAIENFISNKWTEILTLELKLANKMQKVNIQVPILKSWKN